MNGEYVVLYRKTIAKRGCSESELYLVQKPILPIIVIGGQISLGWQSFLKQHTIVAQNARDAIAHERYLSASYQLYIDRIRHRSISRIIGM